MLVKELITTLQLCNPEASIHFDIGDIFVPILGAFVSSRVAPTDVTEDNYINEFMFTHPDEMPINSQCTVVLTDNPKDFDEDMMAPEASDVLEEDDMLDDEDLKYDWEDDEDYEDMEDDDLEDDDLEDDYNND